jgi:transposase
MTDNTIGVDISKDTLDAHRLSDGATAQFSNDPGGFRALVGWLSKAQVIPAAFASSSSPPSFRRKPESRS